MKILLYDDHILVTEAIASYIRNVDHKISIVQCQTTAAVKESVGEMIPDIFISDVLSPENAGLSLFHYFNQFYPSVKIIVYTSITNSYILESLINLGIFRVVNKSEKISTLWESVEETLKTQKTVTISDHPELILTIREKEVVEYLSKGMSAKEIAKLLGTSVNTVNNQKNELLARLNCNNSTDLVIKLTQMGFIGIY